MSAITDKLREFTKNNGGRLFKGQPVKSIWERGAEGQYLVKTDNYEIETKAVVITATPLDVEVLIMALIILVTEFRG